MACCAPGAANFPGWQWLEHQSQLDFVLPGSGGWVFCDVCTNRKNLRINLKDEVDPRDIRCGGCLSLLPARCATGSSGRVTANTDVPQCRCQGHCRGGPQLSR
jgi:hypothetical protein